MSAGLNSETKRNVDASQPEILAVIKETGVFQSITVEYYGNGTIKRIQKNFNPLSVLMLGIPATLFGVSVYFVGPEAVTEYAKTALALAQAAHGVSNTLQGRPSSNLVYN